jgi:hypothetical protein
MVYCHSERSEESDAGNRNGTSDPSLTLRMTMLCFQILHSASGSVQDDSKKSFRMTGEVLFRMARNGSGCDDRKGA